MPREYTRRLRALRLIAATALLLIGWITTIGAAKIHRGLYPYSSDWIPLAVTAIVCVGLAIWLARPFAPVKTARELIEHRWLLTAVLAVGGSMAIAIGQSAAFWPIGLGFLIYSGMVPLRLANQARWWREAVAAGAAWTIVWSALGITTSEVGPHAHDEPALFGLLGPALFVPFLLVSALLRMTRRRAG
jgi:hypothetical protein